MERFENAERAFFNLRPGNSNTSLERKAQSSVVVPKAVDNAEDTVDEDFDDNEKLKQLRKVVKGKTHGKSLADRRKLWRQKARHYESHSPAFMKKTSYNLDTGEAANVNYIGDASPFRSKLYASNPSLTEYKQTLQAMGGDRYSLKNRSMPNKMSRISSYPSILFSQSQPSSKAFPKITSFQPHNVLFSDEVLGAEVVEEITYEKEELEEEEGGEGAEYAETELASTYAPSSVGATSIRADWLLQEQLKSEMKKFERTRKSLMIKIDDDTINSLERRMDEIMTMVRPKKDPRKVIDRLPPNVRILVLKVKAVPLDELKRNKRKKWKLKDLFKWSISMVTFLLRCFWNRKKYYIDKSNIGQLRMKIEREMKNNQSLTPTSKSSIPSHLETALRTMPHLRDKTCVAHVLWLLRTTKAFKALFPAEMEQELARNVSYEKYDDGRILAYQSRTPDRFYYVLAGRASVLRQFRLSTDNVTKHMGYLSKGNTTDPEEMEKQWMREDSLVAKGQVEVLILERAAFDYLQTTHQGPPVDFIKTVDIFESFEPQTFFSHPDAIEYKYYGQGKVIVKDSNRTQWLHLVKSGTVKVVRKQTVLDSISSNENKFRSRNVDELGCGKYPSHAKAMLGVQARQKKLQEMRLGVSQEFDILTNPFANTLGIDKDETIAEAEGEQTQAIKRPLIFRASAKTHLKFFESKSSTSKQAKLSRPSTVAKPEYPDINELDVSDDEEESIVMSGSNKREKRRHSGTKLPAINIPMRVSRMSVTDDQMQNIWLTREVTEPCLTIHKNKEPQRRKTFLQLDVLKTGDVFGLDHLQPALASEPQGYSLVSDGAEVVKISKRFFLQFASNNSMMKVETMFKHYLTEEDATDRLYEKETWDQYKTALWEKITEDMPMPSTVR